MADITIQRVVNAQGHPVEIKAGNAAADAFGRLRISSPFTLFDSSFRYGDNGKWYTLTSGSATLTFNQYQGLMQLGVTTASGDKVYRETSKVFSYQPGKSLLVMNTFVMAPKQKNQRQRVGYFSNDNGIFVEQNENNEPEFVLRSIVNTFEIATPVTASIIVPANWNAFSTAGEVTINDGITVTLLDNATWFVGTTVPESYIDTKVKQSDWEYDKLNGKGKSTYKLDLNKVQIFWADFEWLGAGTVRVGFVINGKFIHCHSFHHANKIDSTYITTASLPCRYEIENLDTTTTSGILKQICTTVLSEGGYEVKGDSYSIATSLDSPYALTATGVKYPVISLRLVSGETDRVALPTHLEMIGVTNNTNYKWSLIQGGETSGGTWATGNTNTSVEYNLSGSSFTQGSGVTLANGFTTGSNKTTAITSLNREDIFKYQLERNSFTSTPIELTFVVEVDSASSEAFASINWEEV